MKIPLFDIDGVIISKATNKPHFEACNHIFRSIYNKNASVSEIDADGEIDNQIIIKVLELHGLSTEMVKKKLKKATKEMGKYFYIHETEENYVSLAGVKKLLIELKNRKIPIGVLSGNVETIGWRKIELAGVRKYFDFGAFGDSAFKRVDLIKIARKKTEKILNKTVPHKTLVIVGDTPRDIQCGKEGGIATIGVATGLFSEAELKKEGADLIVPSFEKEENRKRVIDFLSG